MAETPTTAGDGGSPPTLVLVHGAWHGGWSWDPVLPALAAHGVPAHVVDLPGVGRAPGGHDLAGHAAYLREEVARLPGPVALCGHSYGGAVLTEAAPADAVVLIYLAAFLLRPGESCVDANAATPPLTIPRSARTARATTCTSPPSRRATCSTTTARRSRPRRRSPG
ncbi:alpha/beta fold hydrolase [Nonomuraea antimicrobica]